MDLQEYARLQGIIKAGLQEYARLQGIIKADRRQLADARRQIDDLTARNAALEREIAHLSATLEKGGLSPVDVQLLREQAAWDARQKQKKRA